MTKKLEDQFWESAISEVARGDSPPDQKFEILMRLEIPESRAESATAAQVAPKRRLFASPIKFAAALVAFGIIGVLTGVIPVGDSSGSGTSNVKHETSLFSASPESEYEEIDGNLYLSSGFVLLSTGSPDLICGDSALTNINGLALAHAGPLPTKTELLDAQQWANSNKLGELMSIKLSRWVTTASMAVCIFAGSAILDGQEIGVPDSNKPTIQREYRTVKSLMELERLSTKATHIRLIGDDVSDDILEFVAEAKSIRSLQLCNFTLEAKNVIYLSKMPKLVELDLEGCEWEDGNEDENLEHIIDYKVLETLQSLTHLDLRGCLWDTDDGAPDYSIASSLPKLKWLGVDVQDDRFKKQLKLLTSISKRGITIQFGTIQADAELLGHINSALPSLPDLKLEGAVTVEIVKVLSQFKNLKSLIIEESEDMIELDWAYLGRNMNLNVLKVMGECPVLAIHHVAKIESLHTLSITIDLESEIDCITLADILTSWRGLNSLDLGIDENSLELVSSFLGELNLQSNGKIGIANLELDCEVSTDQLIAISMTGIKSLWVKYDIANAYEYTGEDETLAPTKNPEEASTSRLEELHITESRGLGLDDVDIKAVSRTFEKFLRQVTKLSIVYFTLESEYWSLGHVAGDMMKERLKELKIVYQRAES